MFDRVCFNVATARPVRMACGCVVLVCFARASYRIARVTYCGPGARHCSVTGLTSAWWTRFRRVVEAQPELAPMSRPIVDAVGVEICA